METVDYIIVGAGSAGCALAYRLATKDSTADVLLLEAGSPANNPLLHMPLGFAFLMKPHKNNWNYRTKPEPYLKQRRIDLPRGKVMGGCSAINGMVYVRGQAADYDRWAELGNHGWSYDDVLPYFKLSEDCENGADTYHGVGGPLWVGNVQNEFPLCDAFIHAAEQAGHRRNPDFNGATQEGVGFFSHNIKNGKRWSSASAFVTSSIPPNLTVLPFAHVTRVLLENRKAIAVECLVKGVKKRFNAQREIILSGGAINSPQLLERSGIGSADLLHKLGIPVVVDLPGVGENLQDHWNAYIKQGVRKGRTYFDESKPLAMMKNLARYFVRKEGFLANPAAMVAVFYRALPDSQRPDAQIHFAPGASKASKRGNRVPLPGMTIATCGLRPTSRGSTHINSVDPDAVPSIQVNYLQSKQDQLLAVAAFRKARQILTCAAINRYCWLEKEPGLQLQTFDEILEYIRQTGEPVHHLAGSCKMGHDGMAVVDAKLRVHGVENLRIADASIMPEIISGNTHAACVMIGEKAADMIARA